MNQLTLLYSYFLLKFSVFLAVTAAYSFFYDYNVRYRSQYVL